MSPRPNPAVDELKKDVASIKEAVKEQAQTVNQAIEAVNKLAATMARNNPVILEKHLEADEQDLGQQGAARFTEKDGEQDIEIEIAPSMDTAAGREKIANLEFMEEEVMVHIHSTSEKDADKVFEINVCGDREIFRRGEKRPVKRKFVEGLARAKPIAYDSTEVIGADGLQHYEYPSQKGLRYPFSLVNPTSMDNAWLTSVLAQP